jgi:hypothetical protein
MVHICRSSPLLTMQPKHVALLAQEQASSLLLLLPLPQDVVYCPRCEAVCIEDKDHCAQCSNCLYVFCSFCQDSWHPGSECLDPHEVRHVPLL